MNPQTFPVTPKPLLPGHSMIHNCLSVLSKQLTACTFSVRLRSAPVDLLVGMNRSRRRGDFAPIIEAMAAKIYRAGGLPSVNNGGCVSACLMDG